MDVLQYSTESKIQKMGVRGEVIGVPFKKGEGNWGKKVYYD